MIIQGDARHIPLKDKSVQCVVTSPPYWGLRDYGTATWQGGDEECDHLDKPARNDIGPADLARRAEQYATGTGNGSQVTKMQFRHHCGKCGATRIDNQIGLEKTPEEYVQNMIAVFREVRRLLRDDGTCWINLGDSYAAQQGNGFNTNACTGGTNRVQKMQESCGDIKTTTSLPPKNLVGIPWRVAFALQADGWYLRSDIIWSKPNPMPESVTDRPTKAHEYIFLLSKNERYFFNQDAVREPHQDKNVVDGIYQGNGSINRSNWIPETQGWNGTGLKMNSREYNSAGRNIRTIWNIATQPYPDAHFATFPEELAKRCILAGSKSGSIVLDPFVGSGTTVQVAQDLGRIGVGIDLKAEYLRMAKLRSAQQGLRLYTVDPGKEPKLLNG